MICDICKKNEARIHFTQSFDGQVTKMNLCESCAKEMGIFTGFISDKSDLLLSPFLAGLGESAEFPADKQCSSCGRSWKKFEESGKLGCAACYETFRKELKTLIRRLHGAAQHKGKEPVTSARELNGEGKMRKLEQELKEAVEKEQYERAAVIRDQIRDLRKNNP